MMSPNDQIRKDIAKVDLGEIFRIMKKHDLETIELKIRELDPDRFNHEVLKHDCQFDWRRRQKIHETIR